MKESLKHFVGKVCTISTIQINFRFKEEQMMDYFMGLVVAIDDGGITLEHPATKCKSYIFFPHIVSIAEEQVLYEDNPQHKELIEAYRQEKPITSSKNLVTTEPQTKEPSPFINATAMAEMARKMKDSIKH